MLYDAVVLLVRAPRARRRWPTLPPARDFVSDAFAHCKFIAHTDGAAALLDAVGLGGKADGGFVALNGNGSVAIVPRDAAASCASGTGRPCSRKAAPNDRRLEVAPDAAARRIGPDGHVLARRLLQTGDAKASTPIPRGAAFVRFARESSGPWRLLVLRS